MSDKPAPQNIEGINSLFDEVRNIHNLSSDAKLARFLDVAPPVISKQRKGTLTLGPSMILSLHERGHMSVSYIRKALEVTK
jgi:hypothetical protein